ncbi:MAG: FAD binding domain-containing protein [Candidatus Limnocylindrales bacterium]|nr:FAD binding domain-containing protein [Candidatus Limnocylindrales bacterium]
MSRALAFLRPETVDEAVALLQEHGDEAKVIAGSTALTIMLRNRLIDPSVLVSIGGLPGLRDIGVTGGVLELGALATHRTVERDAVVRGAIPVLADTFAKVANVRIRNAATVGGVVAEADYASDPPAALLGLDAEIVARGPDGERVIPARDFFVAFYETALAPTEIVTKVRVLVPAAGTGAIYEKFVTRSCEDRPCIGVFASCRQAGPERYTDVRVSVGAAAETPQRFPDLEAEASETDLGEDVRRAIADGYAERIETLDDVRGSAWYRTEMVRVWVRRALESARLRAASLDSEVA